MNKISCPTSIHSDRTFSNSPIRASHLELKMDPLLKAVKTGSLSRVKRTVTTSGIVVDDRWIDYVALNHAIVADHEVIADFLLDHNCRVKNTHSKAFPHQTPLHSAVMRRSSVNLIVKLLRKGASFETLNFQGYTPLHLALILGNDAAIDVILDYVVQTGTYANTRSINGLSHFHVACTRKNAEAINGFIESGIDVNETVSERSIYKPGYSARHFAAEFQSLEAVKQLTKKTKRNHVVDIHGRSPEDLARKSLEDLSVMVYLLSGESSEVKVSQFHLACVQGNPGLVKKFLENGASVNHAVPEDVASFPGYSPLHFAVESNCKENVELLLKEDVDVEHQDANFGTPLHMALYNEDPSEDVGTIVDLLYERLSREDKLFNIMDVYGLNYFHVAVTRNDMELVETFLNVGEDIEREVLFNSKQFAHYRPLHFAVRYGHLNMAEMLIERGANVKTISKDGPPLHIAFEVGDIDLIELLLEYKAKVNVVRKVDGKTMLHSLVESFMTSPNVCLLEYVERLVKLGCDVNHKDDSGNTALHLACEKISTGAHCVRSLLDFGANINVENAGGETPFESAFHDLYRQNADCYMLLYHHVQKLKVLGVRMNPKNESCCQRILDESDKCERKAMCFRLTELDRMKQLRRNEVAILKATKLTEAMSLYGFLRSRRVDASTYVTNEKMKEIMAKEDFDKEFPVYGCLIRLQFWKGRSYFRLARKRKAEREVEGEVVKRRRCE